MVDRNRYITIRSSDEEAAMLHELAEVEGITASDYLRLYIRRSHTEKFKATKRGTRAK